MEYIQSNGASRNSFIPNLAVVQIVQVYTIGIRRKCAFFRSFLSVERRCKVTQIISSSKIFFLLGINKKIERPESQDSGLQGVVLENSYNSLNSPT